MKTLRFFTHKHDVTAGMDNEETELFKTIMNARDELLDTRRHFEYVYEDNLVDYYTYKLKACEARYAHFIKIAKEKGLKGSFSQEQGIVLYAGESNNINRFIV